MAAWTGQIRQTGQAGAGGGGGAARSRHARALSASASGLASAPAAATVRGTAGLGAALRELSGGRLEEHRTVVNGHTMYSLRAGSGSPLILLHGLLGAAVCWAPAMLDLAARSRVYAVDAIGMGGSDRAPGLDPSLRAAAERLRGFLDVEGISKADFCATSHGGAVAMYFAALYPERVRSLVLQAPANPFCSRSRPQIQLFSTSIGQWLGRRIPHAPRRLQAIALERMYGDPSRVRTGSLEEYVSSLRIPGTVDYVLSVLRCWPEDMAQLKRMLRRLRGLPTLLLWGTEDRAVSLASGEALCRVLGAQLDVLPGVGHLPYEEQPAAFAERVSGFLGSLRGLDAEAALPG